MHVPFMVFFQVVLNKYKLIHTFIHRHFGALTVTDSTGQSGTCGIDGTACGLTNHRGYGLA